LPGAEVAEASYGEPEAMEKALAGAETFFMLSASEAADRMRQHVATVDAAASAGVKRIVYLSFLGASPEATFMFARDHWHIEERIRASGVRYAFLRNSLYLNFLPGMAGSDGVIRGPAGDGRVAAVARDVVADVAVAVLLGEGDHDGRTYDVTGPEAITLYGVAEELSRATDRDVTYRAETLEEAYESRASYGAPKWEIEGWVTSYAAISAGEMDVIGDAVAQLAGHEPQNLPEFLCRHPESYRHLSPRPSGVG